MKYSFHAILFCCLIAVPLSSTFAQDPVKLSPQYYKVLIDNDEVRVLEFRFKPGEKEPMHSHPRGFVYSLADSKIRTSFPDGKREESAMKTGEVRWRDAVTHAAENIGDTEAHAVAVELKKPVPLSSQATTSNRPAEFDHVALHVRDLARSAEFYHTVLGLEQVSDPFKDRRHVFFRLGPRSELHLTAGGQTDMERDIDVHFALRVASLSSFVASLQEKHVKYFSSKREEGVVTNRPDGVHQVYLQDPDGYWVELNDSRL